MMAIVHATQKMGWPVNPLLISGILKQRCPLTTISSQRAHGVAFPQVCGSGVPVVRPERHPAWRWRESRSGSFVERGNLSLR
jgi:hypothetical protein